MPLNAMVWTFCPAVENDGCKKTARIVGTCFCELGAGEKPISEAAVTALLNLAAAQRCTSELDCPSKCPASYTEKKKLGGYYQFKNIESDRLGNP